MPKLSANHVASTESDCQGKILHMGGISLAAGATKFFAYCSDLRLEALWSLSMLNTCPVTASACKNHLQDVLARIEGINKKEFGSQTV